jgi:integrase
MAKKLLPEKVQKQLQKAQEKLREYNIGVAIVQRGNRLYLKATLPPKPGSKKDNWHQQDIALGIYANAAGIKRAEAEAKKVGALIALKEFNWEPYLRRKRIAPAQLIEDLIKEYKNDYFTRHGDTPKSRGSWTSNEETYLNRLPANEPLTEHIVFDAINKTPANTATRQKTCEALSRFVKFSGLSMSIDFRRLAGKVEPKERELPDDEEILDWYYKIPDSFAKDIYALLATFGLRPHEIYHLDLLGFQNGEDSVKVLVDTKTGERDTFPLYPEWIDEFSLREIILPEFQTKGKSHRNLGSNLSRMFKRYKIPFTPYDLRHSWARRSIDCGMDPRKAADSMGHKLDTHYEKYNKWFKKKDAQRAYNLLKENPSRRQAPTRCSPLDSEQK